MPYFLSEEFSLVDCAIAPLLWRLRAMGIVLPPEGQPVMEYAKRLFSREAFQVSLTDTERAIGE
jgi:RNA polymerase-associated protein